MPGLTVTNLPTTLVSGALVFGGCANCKYQYYSLTFVTPLPAWRPQALWNFGTWGCNRNNTRSTKVSSL